MRAKPVESLQKMAWGQLSVCHFVTLSLLQQQTFNYYVGRGLCGIFKIIQLFDKRFG
jgi:hypothetical protein